ncbi:MAG: FtsQ-type POTRA domain-containing protein [Elusimicrobiota bacterium]
MKKHKVRLRLKTRIERNRKRKALLFKITALLILLVVLGFAVNKISRFLLTSPIFNVKSIDVSGNTLVSQTAILDCLDFCRKNIFRLNLKKTETQLTEKFPALKKVYIKRRLPNKIISKIEEKIPLAEIAVSNNRIGIDEHLNVFVVPKSYRQLPRISENLTLEYKSVCLKFLKNIRELPVYKNITAVTATSVDDIVFFMNNGCKVCIGSSENSENKINYLEKVFTNLEIEGKKAQYINMRDFTDENKEIIIKAK